jgi:DNA-binding XRE family transcriptional regulator
MMSASQTIKKIRQNMFLEQKEFGLLIGKSKQAVWHYEKGSRLPKLETIRKILDLAKKHKIKVSIEDFLN